MKYMRSERIIQETSMKHALRIALAPLLAFVGLSFGIGDVKSASAFTSGSPVEMCVAATPTGKLAGGCGGLSETEAADQKAQIKEACTELCADQTEPVCDEEVWNLQGLDPVPSCDEFAAARCAGKQ